MIDENVTKQLDELTPENIESDTSGNTDVQSDSTENSAHRKVDQQEIEKQEKEHEQAKNFRELRKQTEAIVRERDEYRRMLEERAHPEDDHDINLEESDLVEAKHLKKQRKYIDKQLESMKKQLEIQQQLLIESKIRAQCPDFDEVVTEENITRLRDEYPEVAATIGASSDLQSKAIASYKLIKKLNISDIQSRVDKETITKNVAKPKPSNALNKTDSSLTRAHGYSTGLSDSQKEAIWKRARDLASKI